MRNLSSVKELTIELNRLRVANGKSPLKAWKESKEKAVDAIKHEVACLKPIVIKEPAEDRMLNTLLPTAPKPTPIEDDEDAQIDAEDFEKESMEAEAEEKTPIEILGPVVKSPEEKALDEAKVSEPAPVEVSETFTVVELAIQLEISPKVARAKLRRTDNLPPKTGKGWTFANDVREALIKILS